MGGDVSPEAERSDWPALKDQPSPIAAAVSCVSLLHAGSTKEPIKQQSGGGDLERAGGHVSRPRIMFSLFCQTEMCVLTVNSQESCTHTHSYSIVNINNT